MKKKYESPEWDFVSIYLSDNLLSTSYGEGGAQGGDGGDGEGGGFGGGDGW